MKRTREKVQKLKRNKQWTSATASIIVYLFEYAALFVNMANLAIFEKFRAVFGFAATIICKLNPDSEVGNNFIFNVITR